MSQGVTTRKRAATRRRTRRPASRAAASRSAAKRTVLKRAAAKRTIPKRAVAKRAPTKRAPAKRAAASKRAAAKRTVAKRAAAPRRATAQRSAAKRAVAKRAPPKRTPAKRAAASKRAAAKRTVAKRAAAPRRATAQRSAAKRAVAKRVSARRAATRRPAVTRTAPPPLPAPVPPAALLPVAPRHDAGALQEELEAAGRAAGAPGETLGQVRAGDAFALLEWLVPRRGSLPGAAVQSVTAAAEALLRHRIFVHPGAGGGRVVPVVFGTGGHRGVIGAGLTLLHVHVIVTALLRAIAAQTPAQRAEHFGTAELAEVKRRGFVIGHDNRLFNPEFSFFAASLLREQGYTVRYAGRVTSPELSLLVPLRGWAGSLNFTPSHNPFRWGGLKLAPADGGLAGGDLTDPLAAEANRLLQATLPANWPRPERLEARIAAEAQRIETVDVHDTYLDRLNVHPVVRLADLIAKVRALPAGRRLAFVADPVWGAAVPVYQRLQRRMGADVLRLLHTEVDPYFGGQVTEPNEHTLAEAVELLKGSPAAAKVAIRNDPDSDRGLVGDAGGAIQMNRFAALVYRYLGDTGQRGDLVTTLPTSQLGPDYARAHGGKVILTPTGFKNFRPYLKGGKALMAYEESNGITIRGHTLDKDGVLAGLLAVRIVLHYGRPLGELIAELEREQGRYFYRQETFVIDLSAAEAHERLKKLGTLKPGDAFQVGARALPIRAVNAEDGYKLTLDDGAWVMMRPSGTEPKVRVYAETRQSEQATQELCGAARKLALAAIQSGPQQAG